MMMVLAIVMVVKGYGYDGGCNGYGDDFDVDLNDGGGVDDDVFDSDTGWGNGDDIGGSGCGGDDVDIGVGDEDLGYGFGQR